MIVTPFKPNPGSITDFGAEIRGLDLAAPMSDETFKALETAVYTHGVVIVRDQVCCSKLCGPTSTGKINIRRSLKPPHPCP